MNELTTLWAEWIKPSAGLPTVQWSVLLALAAASGHVLQRQTGLPKVVGYSIVGALAGLAGFQGVAWPLQGVGLFMIELGLSMLLFEAGGRITLRWFRHNPMVLVQSLVESALTFAAVYWVLQTLEVNANLIAPLALLSVAASPAVLMRVASDSRAAGPVTDRAIALATLNTLYALTLGSVMARFLDRPDVSLMGAVYPVAVLLGISVVFGGVLALALRSALRVMNPTSENTSVLLLALVSACTTLAAHFGGSAPLAALLAGLLLKAMNPRPWSWPRQLGTASSILTILMFVLVSTVAAQASWNWALFTLVAALVATRALAKISAIGVCSIGSGSSLRQALWTGCAMWPMSAVTLLLVSQFVIYAPQLGAQIATIALPAILLMEILGALVTTVALQRAGESAAPVRLRPDHASKEASHDA
jgi:Kef-type K+ transport system membrane component KefB